MQQRVRTASVVSLSAALFLWLSACHDDPQLLGELMTGGAAQTGGESSSGGTSAHGGGTIVSSGGVAPSSGGTSAHGGRSASGGAPGAGGVATNGGDSMTQAGSRVSEGGAGGSAGESSAGSGGSGGLSDQCGSLRCDTPLVCLATRVVGGAVISPDDNGDCPAGRHPETLGAITRCENDFSYRCAAPAGCNNESLSCACGAATCPSAYPACFDPATASDASMLSPATALVCELQAP